MRALEQRSRWRNTTDEGPGEKQQVAVRMAVVQRERSETLRYGFPSETEIRSRDVHEWCKTSTLTLHESEEHDYEKEWEVFEVHI